MGRTPKSRNSINNTSINNHNNSVVEEEILEEYHEFIGKFLDIEPAENARLIGCDNQYELLGEKLDRLINNQNAEPVFILLEGPIGTGKTTMVKLLAKEFQESIKFFYLRAPWLFTKEFGNVKARLVQLFGEASKKQPSLIFIDEIDRLCPNKKQSDSKESLIYDTLLDALSICESNSMSRVMIVAATNKPQDLDDRIREYFHREIQFNYLNQGDRVEALTLLLNKYQHGLTKDTLSDLACNMAGYSYKALKALCIEANAIAEKNNLTEIDVASFKKAQETMKATIAKSVVTPCPKLEWSDIGGNHRIKNMLIESVIWPIQYAKKYQKKGLKAPKGALLYGPPGCSKTMMARAIATESKFNFICVKGPELLSKWVGETEAEVRKLYRNAKMIAPCIIFFDEFDTFGSTRSGESNNGTADRVVGQLLTEISCVEPLEGVFTMAATNRPHLIDKAFLRPGRLESVIYVSLPTRDERKEIFDIHIKPSSDPVIVDTGELADRTNGYSGADIERVCQQAFLAALREDVEQVDIKHFEVALTIVKPSVDASAIDDCEKFIHGSRKDNNEIDYARKNKTNSTKSVIDEHANGGRLQKPTNARHTNAPLYRRLSMRMDRLLKK